MAVYAVVTREVMLLGKGWYGQTLAYQYDLPKNIIATREEVQIWLDIHAGDFQSIDDFSASIADIEIPWATEEAEATYNDIMFGEG